MKLGVFDIDGPLPELEDPHALAILKPWVDVSNVGSLTLSSLETYFNARNLAKLTRPGDFFDFTRYRPNLYLKDGRREIEIPNTTISYAKREKGHDFIFLRLYEPHMMAEAYIDSLKELFRTLGVRRYCLLGAMYHMVPYTRPLLVTGTASNADLQSSMAAKKVMQSNYQGDTTILYLITQQLYEWDVETLSMIVHLPNYLVMKDDYRGERRLMEVISSLYDLSLLQVNVEKAKEQEEHVSQIAEQMLTAEPRYKLILQQLETSYDSRIKEGEDEIELSPEVEQFLQEMNRRFGQSEI